MRKEYLYGIIGLLSGILLTIVFASNAVNTNNQQIMRMMGMNQASNQYSQGMRQMMGDSEMTMSGMVDSLKGKTGEEFDKAFIEEMILHHQGAIDMANLAKINAFHQEIKKLSENIISAQTEEIDMMRQWQKVWGY